MKSVILSGENLKKSFGGVKALNNMNFSLEEGEILGLIGPNGAGKTTLFNAITGFIPLDDGTIKYDGKEISDLSPHSICRIGITKTHQVPRPFLGMTLLENVKAAGIHGGKLSPRESGKISKETLEFVGLLDRGEEYPDSLGFFDLKLLDLARALATNPKVLLIDEPASGLSVEEARKMVNTIKEIRKRGKSVIWIEHIIETIAEGCEKVMVMHDGRKLTEGSAHEVIMDEKTQDVYLGEVSASGIR